VPCASRGANPTSIDVDAGDVSASADGDAVTEPGAGNIEEKTQHDVGALVFPNISPNGHFLDEGNETRRR
jgi:hypothetical protein